MARICPRCEVEFFEDETHCPGHNVPLIENAPAPSAFRFGLVSTWGLSALLDVALVWGAALGAVALWRHYQDWRGFGERWALVGSIACAAWAVAAVIVQARQLRGEHTVAKTLFGLQIEPRRGGWGLLLVREFLVDVVAFVPILVGTSALWQGTFELWPGRVIFAGIAVLTLDAIVAVVPPHRSLRDYIFGTEVKAG